MSALPELPFPPDQPPTAMPPSPWRPGRRILVGIAITLAALMVLGIAAVFVLLHSPAVHRYVLKMAEQKLSASLAAPVKIEDFSLRFSGISPAVDVYNLEIGGAAPHGEVPLLRAERAGVAVRIVSIWGHKWYLQEVSARHPVVRVVVDENGASNLPHPTSSGESQTDLFDLGVRHVLLERGEIYYNDRKLPLDAELRDLGVTISFDPAAERYSGVLGYRGGQLHSGPYAPFSHHLQARFAATRSALVLERLDLASGSSHLQLAGTLHDYRAPSVDVRYDATLDAGEVGASLKQPTLPAGVVRLSGKAHYVSQENHPLLEAFTVEGSLASGLLTTHQAETQVEVHDLAASYTLAHGNAEVRNLRANILGGYVSGNLTMRNIGGTARSTAQAEVRGISLAQLKPLANADSLRQVAVDGTLDGTIDASWGKSFDDLIANSDSTIRAGVGSSQTGPKRVPVNGDIHARYDARTEVLALRNSSLRTPETTIALEGTVSSRSALQLQLQANDLHELENIASLFGSASSAPRPVLELYGTAAFRGSVSGSTSAPHLQGQLSAGNLRVKGTSWKSLRANVSANPSLVNLQNGELVAVDGGRATFSLNAALTNWVFTKTSSAQVSLKVQRMNAGDLAKMANLPTPVAGTLSGNIAVHGDQLNPVGQGNMTLSRANIAGQPFQSVSVDFRGDGNQVNANLSARTPAGNAQGVVKYYPKQQGYEAQLQVPGLQIAQLQAVRERNLPLAGVVTLNATGRGTIDNPGWEAEIHIPQLRLHDQNISGLKLQARVGNHVAEVTFDSQVANTTVRGNGTVRLQGDYEAVANLDTQTIPLQPLLAAYAPAQAGNFTGQTELHATLRGPLKDKSRLEAHLTIPTLGIDYQNKVQIGASAPIKADYANGVLTLQRASIGGTGTNLQFQGSIPIAGDGPVSLLLLGTVDLQVAQLFIPDISSSGQLQFDINSYGQRGDPNVEGQVRIVNANFASASAPVGLQNGNGVLTLTKDRLNITQFTADVGGGKLLASGGVVYRPGMRFDLAMKANGLRMLYPQGVREAVDANLALTGTTEDALLSGAIKIEELAFTSDFELSNFIDQMSGGTTPAPSQGFTQNLKLNLGVQSTNAIHLVSKTLTLDGTANLRVTGTADRPIILGRVNLAGGDLIFGGRRYVLQTGTLAFVNPVETQPVVNVVADTTVQQYNIHLRFDGPVNRLRTEYSSDPALAPADIINLLATGKTTEAPSTNASSTGIGGLVTGAEPLIASQVSSQITNRLQKVAGISQLSVDPLLGCNRQNPGACVTIQQRVTSNLFITFSTDVASIQRETIQGQYQVTPRVSISGTRDQNGGFGFDARIKKTW